jgi:Cysteine rich repeat
MSKLVLAFALFFTGLSFALAQGGSQGTPQEQQACSRDASRFCRQQLGDDTAVQQCLRQHRQKLSSACQKVFQSHGQ